jgi:RNA polymerase primary sigma factor
VADDGSELGDLVADPAPHPDEVVVAALTAGEVSRLLPLLDDGEREVLVLRFGLHGGPPMTLAAVSRALGVSPDVARHRQTRALRTLRRGIEATPISRYSRVACS